MNWSRSCNSNLQSDWFTWICNLILLNCSLRWWTFIIAIPHVCRYDKERWQTVMTRNYKKERIGLQIFSIWQAQTLINPDASIHKLPTNFTQRSESHESERCIITHPRKERWKQDWDAKGTSDEMLKGEAPKFDPIKNLWQVTTKHMVWRVLVSMGGNEHY